jgi:hypothetical protein
MKADPFLDDNLNGENKRKKVESGKFQNHPRYRKTYFIIPTAKTGIPTVAAKLGEFDAALFKPEK